MTTTPGNAPGSTPESARVAALEQQLADAAAQVAKVQAELSHARAADPAHPQVPVPYDGQAPVVMINGQQVPAGQAVDVTAMLGSMFGGAMGADVAAQVAAAQATPGLQAVSIPPVVTVNGQVVQNGQSVDLSSVIGPEALAQVRSSLEQLGLGGMVGMLGGHVATGHSPSPPAAGSAVPGPAAALPYASTPGEVTGSGNRVMLWLAAVLVLGLIGVVAYLGLTG
jgi:hypothetical protein